MERDSLGSGPEEAEARWNELVLLVTNLGSRNGLYATSSYELDLLVEGLALLLVSRLLPAYAGLEFRIVDGRLRAPGLVAARGRLVAFGLVTYGTEGPEHQGQAQCILTTGGLSTVAQLLKPVEVRQALASLKAALARLTAVPRPWNWSPQRVNDAALIGWARSVYGLEAAGVERTIEQLHSVGLPVDWSEEQRYVHFWRQLDVS